MISEFGLRMSVKHNIWGGPLEINVEEHGLWHEEEEEEEEEEEFRRRRRGLDRAPYEAPSDEVKQRWLRRPDILEKSMSSSSYCNKSSISTLVCLVTISAIIVLIIKLKPHYHPPSSPTLDNYTLALPKALLFFNAQQSGKLPLNNNVSWRGDSCLKDEQVGGYYDGGDSTKYNFPAAFAMTMLSWSVLEYNQKYESALELHHVKHTIKWGTDYLLKTFTAYANSTTTVASQLPSPTTKHNNKCWIRPEEIQSPRPASHCTTCPALAAETAAALAAASIVFHDNEAYSKKLIHGADVIFRFATQGLGGKYSGGADPPSLLYNSSGFWDEFLWGGTWMYLATGNSSYLNLITSPELDEKVGSMRQSVLSWDNKLPGAALLLARLRMFLDYGYPYEQVLKNYQNKIDDIVCSYLPNSNKFNRTKGGLIMLNHGNPRPLQYVVNAAFLAKLYSDYMGALYVPGIMCGGKFYRSEALEDFARTQVDYILGKNPEKMSYVVGFGERYPEEVHHMGASIMSEKGKKYGCGGGWKWRDRRKPNPNVIVGAMVGGPDKLDGFNDLRSNYNYTEPSLAGNSGLVAALVALSQNATPNSGIDHNTIFYSVRLP
ncbi:endoglucanase 25-like [Arachis hypogaea]|nr:endoglucanase 25-like [Arachis hypogaea]